MVTFSWKSFQASAVFFFAIYTRSFFYFQYLPMQRKEAIYIRYVFTKLVSRNYQLSSEKVSLGDSPVKIIFVGGSPKFCRIVAPLHIS